MYKLNYILWFVVALSLGKVFSQNNSDERIVEVDNGYDYEVVDQMAEFPGGEKALYDFVSKNMVYPPLAKENGISGKVWVQFEVDTAGNISNIKVMRGIGSGCDEEAVRVIKKMPAWKPGMNNNKPARCRFTLPINFKLN